MERLTTNKNVSEMGMYELAMNSCYSKDGLARYRDFEKDVDARELTRELLKKYAEGDDAFESVDAFDDEMLDLLQCGDTVYYIFDYEIVECINCGVSMDCEGKLWIALACDEHIFSYRNPIPEIDLDPTDWCMNTTEVTLDEWGKTVFLTREEAEKALADMGCKV